MKQLKQIKNLEPKYGPALKLMGEIYMREKKYDRAVEHLKDAMSLDAKDP